MSKDLEISNAINVIKKYHNKIIILHCVSGYPTKLKDTDLSKINFLKKKFPKYKIGLSDHTNNIHSSIAAAALGVVMIEKHVKLDDKTKTADSEFSINLNKLKKLKKITIDIFNSTHKRSLITNLSEKNKNLRRSIFAKNDIKKDEKINEKNIVCLRPNIGICASKYFFVLGKKAKKNIKKGMPIKYNLIT
jgi:sialic acid synthase SpsE